MVEVCNFVKVNNMEKGKAMNILEMAVRETQDQRQEYLKEYTQRKMIILPMDVAQTILAYYYHAEGGNPKY